MLRIGLGMTLVFLSCTLSLVGCGDSGGSAANSSEVAILITDGPADEYDSIFVTIEEISLIPTGDGTPVVLFHSAAGEEIDILELRDEDLLLTIGRGIPSGSYGQVRIVITQVRTEGGECDDVEVTLPDGPIDVTPEEPIQLTPGAMFCLRLDIDANKSIEADTTGKTPDCSFQPVVFLEVIAGSIPDACPESLVGTVAELTTDTLGVVTGFVLDLGGDRGSVDVDLRGATGIFDADGLAASADILAAGRTVTVRGVLDDDGTIDALVVVLGETVSVAGAVDSVTDETRFVVEPDEGSGIVDAVEVAVVEGTLVLANCKPAAPDVIQPGAPVTVAGKLSVEDPELRAVIVEVAPRRLQGSLVEATAVEEGTEIMVIPEGDTDPVTLLVPDDVRIQLEGDGEIPAEVLEVVLDCGPREVTVRFDLSDPTTPSEVRVGAESLGGELESVDAAASELVIGGQTVSVLPDAMILDLRGGEQKLISLGDLEPGSALRVFGLAACEQVDFYGFLVLVLDDAGGRGDDDDDDDSGDDEGDDDDDAGDDDDDGDHDDRRDDDNGHRDDDDR